MPVQFDSPAKAKAYLAKSELHVLYNEHRWRKIWGGSLEACSEPSVPASQEDHIYLQEVILALAGRPEPAKGLSRAECVARFLLNADGLNAQKWAGDRLTLTEKNELKRTRKWLRRWAEANS